MNTRTCSACARPSPGKDSEPCPWCGAMDGEAARSALARLESLIAFGTRARATGQTFNLGVTELWLNVVREQRNALATAMHGRGEETP